MILLCPCLPSVYLFRDGQHQSLAQRLVLVNYNLSPPVMDHQSTDPSHMLSCYSFIVSTGSFISVRATLPHLEHLYVVFNEMKKKPGDPLDLDEVMIKLCFRVLI